MSTQIVIPPDLDRALEQAMPPFLHTAMLDARAIAEGLGIPCYLVGGPVRDLLLGTAITDLDLVFEGDALAVAERFAARRGGPLVRHEAFATAMFAFGHDQQDIHIDFITARRESYPYPTSLPVVEPSTLPDDLERRDFTINTLAIRLDTPPTLIDRLGGIADLEAGIMRVLHDQSFRDDPTRILRGARFAARLGFRVEPHTAALVTAAAREGLIERTTPMRILHEVWLSFREPAPEGMFAILHDQKVLAHVFAGLDWRPEIADAFQEARRLVPNEDARRLVLLGLSVWWLTDEQRGAVVRRYGFSTEERRIIEHLDKLRAFLSIPDADVLPPSALDHTLHPLGDAALTVGLIVAPPGIRSRIEQYRQVLRPTATLLNGDDLRALGIPPGPRYRVLLQGVRAAQLDGTIASREDALRWVRDHDEGGL